MEDLECYKFDKKKGHPYTEYKYVRKSAGNLQRSVKLPDNVTENS